MGKKWDYDVPSVEVWAECLRVLKPGGHLLAFAGTRTQHRMAVRIEDAGFEIRDMIAWVYGSGFPKSLDVSKAIDKAAGAVREVVGQAKRTGKDAGTYGAMAGNNLLTAPATDAARQWQGWGTALKPALEPITVARKPLGEKTVAANVLEHGTGAINVDGCRINNLTGQRPIGSFGAWGKEKNLCDLCARLAESHVKQETPETKACSAGSHAEPITSGRVGNTPVDTAKENTGCSVGLSLAEPETSPTANFNLSIGVSGKIPTGQSLPGTKSTTSTETAQTTELKTCNACGCLITDQCTNENTPVTKSAMQNMQNGQENAGPTGRWPSNFIHDGSDEVVGLFPVTTSGGGDRNGAQKGEIFNGVGDTKVSRPFSASSGSAARFFKECQHEEIDLLFCRAKAILHAWQLNQKIVSAAESNSCLSRQAAAFVLSNAVIAASQGGKLLSDVKGLSTTVTERECEMLCETLTTAILILESDALLVQSLDALIQNGCLVNVAGTSKQTGTTTITISLPKSDGYAEPVTFSITQMNAEHGAAESVSRFKYCAKASKKDREGSTHPTMKPTDLMRYLCRLVTQPGGVVLDPFMGSGSTGKAAVLEGFQFIGIEREGEYLDIATRRIADASPLSGLQNILDVFP
jgi:hypothetical protein